MHTNIHTHTQNPDLRKKNGTNTKMLLFSKVERYMISKYLFSFWCTFKPFWNVWFSFKILILNLCVESNPSTSKFLPILILQLIVCPPLFYTVSLPGIGTVHFAKLYENFNMMVFSMFHFTAWPMASYLY
jgi:hypothetical protein